MGLLEDILDVVDGYRLTQVLVQLECFEVVVEVRETHKETLVVRGVHIDLGLTSYLVRIH